jgi:uncharacterized protein (DUF1800 family)
MADLTPISSWTVADAAHLGRRAGFGISPEAAAQLATQAPATAVAAWVDGTGVDRTLFDSVMADRADVVALSARNANPNAPGSVNVPAVPAPHAFLVEGPDTWRNDFTRAQASLAFRMQYEPYIFRERMALFWHNLFATGFHKVSNAALMLKQYRLLREHGLDRFDDLLVAVSKDPAMAIWLDSVQNNASGTSVPNENYAREVMELYSLGADNGYDQQDIAQLARALSGWSFTVPASAIVADPTNPATKRASDGNFRVYDGSANPDGYAWWLGANTTLPRMHASGTITFLGRAFDVGAPPAGMAPGEDAVRSIPVSRAAQCSRFLAQRLLVHFVTARFTSADLTDVATMIQSSGFDMRAVLKTLLTSAYFYSASNRFALVEGPVSWTVRAARALGRSLAAADALPVKGFPAWSSVAGSFDQAGMKLLDPNGPNGWKEDVAWVNSNTVRFRTRLAAAVALGAGAATGSSDQLLFPSDPATWFPAAPASPAAVLTRIVDLLQPGPIPPAVTSAWLTALWPTTFAWDSAGQLKARELAYLLLCSPAGQLY